MISYIFPAFQQRKTIQGSRSKCSQTVVYPCQLSGEWFVFFVAFILMGLFAGNLYAQDITVVSDMDFSDTESLDASQTLIILPSDNNAAVFSISNGTPNAVVEVVIQEKSASLQFGNKVIRVVDFTYGGSLTSAKKGSVGTLDINGSLTNLRVGATASVKNRQAAGVYTSTLTLEVTYP